MNNFKKPSQQFKLKWYQNIYWAVKDFLFGGGLFYSSPRQAKKMWEADEALVDKYQYSPNFLEDWRFIFTSIIHGLNKEGYWTIGSEKPHDHDKYVAGIKDSLALNGFKNIFFENYPTQMVIVDLNMSPEKKKKYLELMDTQDGNMKSTMEWHKQGLKRNETVRKALGV